MKIRYLPECFLMQENKILALFCHWVDNWVDNWVDSGMY